MSLFWLIRGVGPGVGPFTSLSAALDDFEPGDRIAQIDAADFTRHMSGLTH